MSLSVAILGGTGFLGEHRAHRHEEVPGLTFATHTRRPEHQQRVPDRLPLLLLARPRPHPRPLLAQGAGARVQGRRAGQVRRGGRRGEDVRRGVRGRRRHRERAARRSGQGDEAGCHQGCGEKQREGVLPGRVRLVSSASFRVHVERNGVKLNCVRRQRPSYQRLPRLRSGGLEGEAGDREGDAERVQGQGHRALH